jgi:hypothetical protein
MRLSLATAQQAAAAAAAAAAFTVTFYEPSIMESKQTVSLWEAAGDINCFPL